MYSLDTPRSSARAKPLAWVLPARLFPVLDEAVDRERGFRMVDEKLEELLFGGGGL